MEKIIIAIHGLGQKPSKPVLEDWWLRSIREGFDRIGADREAIPFEIVYWADILYPAPQDPAVTNSEDPLYIDEPYIKGSWKLERKEDTIKTKLFKIIDSQLDKVFLNDDLSINFKAVTDQIIRRFFSDLARYFRDDCISLQNPECSAKTDIQNRLFEVIRKYQGADILLIGHSMGSLIAYDVLYEYSRQLDIDTLVTIGSPLGLPVIMGRKFAEQKRSNRNLSKPAAPDCIRSCWYNLSDPEDKVAMDPTLNDDYAPNRLGTAIVDMTVRNDYEINGRRNTHKAYGYLRTPELAGIIDGFLSRKNQPRLFRRYDLFRRKVKTGIRNFRDQYLKRR